MLSIFSAVCSFLVANKAAIVSKVIASASYDLLKKVLNFSALKDRISKYFDKEEQTDEYLQELCRRDSINPHKPERDIEDIYEQVTKKEYKKEIFEQFSEWVKENEEQIITVSKMDFVTDSGFNIGIQNAGKDIYNIRGDYKPERD